MNTLSSRRLFNITALITTMLAVTIAQPSVANIANDEPLRVLQRVSLSQPQEATFFVVSRQGGNSTNEIYRYTVTGVGAPAIYQATITSSNVTNPYGLAFDSEGIMYVTNAYISPSVARFVNPAGTATDNGAILNPSLHNPVGVVIRGQLMYVVQTEGSILVFRLDANGAGILINTITDHLTGGSVRNVAISPSGNELLVSQCCGGDSVVRFTLDGIGNAAFKDVINGNGLGGSHDLVFSPWGELFVANAGNGISRFTFDDGGNPVANGELTGNGLAGPLGLDFSPWGELFAASHFNSTISRWTFANDPPHTKIEGGSFSTPNTMADLMFLPSTPTPGPSSTPSNTPTPSPSPTLTKTPIPTYTSTVMPMTCITPPAGLVSWWPGDGNADDYIGSNNGRLVGGVVFTTGKVGQTFSFDGASVVLAPATGFPTGAAPRTVTFWSKLGPADNWVTGDGAAAFGYDAEAVGKGFHVFPVHTGNGNKLAFTGHGSAYDIFAPTDLRDGLWHFIAVTYDSAVITIYADGTPVVSQSLNLDTGISGGAAIGGRAIMQAFLKGEVDEAAIWNRALSASEIQAVFDADSAGMCKPTNVQPTPTSTPGPSLTPSSTPMPTSTPGPSPTPSKTPMPTPIPTSTATATQTPTSTSTATTTPTRTPTPTNTSTPTLVPATYYLHGARTPSNPVSLYLDGSAPSTAVVKWKDSIRIQFSNGNAWQKIGTWAASPSLAVGNLSTVDALHVWLGLKNSDDQGTRFDIRAELYKNGILIGSGETHCITGVTRNANLASEALVVFDSYSITSFNSSSDVLSLKLHTRIGTNSTGGLCGGHSNATGLRLYFDAATRQSRFGGAFGP